MLATKRRKSIQQGSEWDRYDYQHIDSIDFSKIYHLFRTLPLFDDTYLNMQGLNIGMIDSFIHSFITEQEYNLLHTYIEIEKTPTELALFVSAQSQMWIFALYELLRTWKQRMNGLKRWKENGALDQMLKRVEKDQHSMGALMRARHIEWIRDDESVLDKFLKAQASLEPVYEMTSLIRMNLAKHEVKGKKNSFVRAPGYGRINGLCGAMDYQIDLEDNSITIINRRDIADALRKVSLKS